MSELQQREQGWVEQSVTGAVYWIETCFWITLTLVLTLAAAAFSPWTAWAYEMSGAWCLITPLATLAAIGSGGIGLRKIRQRRLMQASTTSGILESNLQHPKVSTGGERELLLAIRDNGGSITPAVAAIETSLTVREADRMLSELSSEGHL